MFDQKIKISIFFQILTIENILSKKHLGQFCDVAKMMILHMNI
jgi:hypothetical protein